MNIIYYNKKNNIKKININYLYLNALEYFGFIFNLVIISLIIKFPICIINIYL